jgi:hypothetical protein
MKREDRFNLRVKGNIKDLLAFKNLLTKRKKTIEHAPKTPIPDDTMKLLSERLHPLKQNLVIKEIRDITKSTKLYKLTPDIYSDTKTLAFFRAGLILLPLLHLMLKRGFMRLQLRKKIPVS